MCSVHTSCWYKNHSGNASFISLTMPDNNPDHVLCVTLEVGQDGAGCCCIVHCVVHHRASLRLVVNSNKDNTHEQPLM